MAVLRKNRQAHKIAPDYKKKSSSLETLFLQLVRDIMLQIHFILCWNKNSSKKHKMSEFNLNLKYKVVSKATLSSPFLLLEFKWKVNFSKVNCGGHSWLSS